MESTAFLKDAASEAKDRSLQDDVRQLIDDARALAEVEVAYQKARAAYAGQEARRIVVLGALVAMLVFFSLMALTLGLVLALTPKLTAVGATAAVCGALLAIALLCAFLALLRWKRMSATLSDETSV